MSNNGFTFITSWMDILEPTLWNICKQREIQLTHLQYNKLIAACENVVHELGMVANGTEFEDFWKLNNKCENMFIHLVYKAKNNEL